MPKLHIGEEKEHAKDSIGTYRQRSPAGYCDV